MDVTDGFKDQDVDVRDVGELCYHPGLLKEPDAVRGNAGRCGVAQEETILAEGVGEDLQLVLVPTAKGVRVLQADLHARVRVVSEDTRYVGHNKKLIAPISNREESRATHAYSVKFMCNCSPGVCISLKNP